MDPLEALAVEALPDELLMPRLPARLRDDRTWRDLVAACGGSAARAAGVLARRETALHAAPGESRHQSGFAP